MKSGTVCLFSDSAASALADFEAAEAGGRRVGGWSRESWPASSSRTPTLLPLRCSSSSSIMPCRALLHAFTTLLWHYDSGGSPWGCRLAGLDKRGGIRIDHFQVTRLGPLHIRLYRRTPIDWHPDFDHFQVACFTRLTLPPLGPRSEYEVQYEVGGRCSRGIA